MKLSKLIENLQAIHKEYGDLDCVYAKDDEGNEFQLIHYEPTVGEYDSEDRYFEQQDNDNEEYVVEINAVCVN